MNYRTDPKSGGRLSVLGFGCMRLPRGLSGRIDADKTEELILSAVERGVNYFDTAYLYPGSEQALGGVLRRNPGLREKINIATKLPLYQCKTYEDFDRIFAIQLERLGTETIDYYLMHNISGMDAWNRVRDLGVEKWLAEKKAAGKIRAAGFSFHGPQSDFMTLLDAYDWDFCQIQYNYMNENYQAGTAGLLRAHEKGLPVVVMEPLLGGKLAAGLPKKAEKAFKDADPARTPASWALAWLWNHEAVTVVLSGMNAEAQLDDNCKAAEAAKAGALTQQEAETIAGVVGIFKEAYRVPCTGCNYCLPCPQGVNIPGCFAAYNVSFASGYVAGLSQYLTGIGAIGGKTSSARKCVKCGRCEKLCPQHIGIMQSLDAVAKRMEPFWLRLGIRIYTGGK